MVSSDSTIILLSTYNGAAYIEQQIASILWQTDKNWCLLWRDDGSSDDTVAVVERIIHNACIRRFQRISEPEGNIGIVASYSALLRAVPSDAARVAFCDQDDVWLPYKLSRASDVLSIIPNTMPALYCARQVLVSHDLQHIGLSPNAPGPKELRNALVENIATGNTIVLNNAAISILKASQNSMEIMHDWWAYLVLTASGGKIIFDSSPVILYRQHDGNTIGAHGSRFFRFLNAARRGPQHFLSLVSTNATALSLHPALTPSAQLLLREVENLHEHGILTRLRAILRIRLARQFCVDQLIMIALLLLLPLPNRNPRRRRANVAKE